eukprot:TRINITY_DN4010_c0_g1_i1.p1 TRINITY_DN4010_c0_g1~~TRINITY_DN4010_c0_g1_i1.p1  ORF type:complete len:536 (+),score=115.27 TRINITY_DN4010_c0_g1_i1:102-1709(+)
MALHAVRSLQRREQSPPRPDPYTTPTTYQLAEEREGWAEYHIPTHHARGGIGGGGGWYHNGGDACDAYGSAPPGNTSANPQPQASSAAYAAGHAHPHHASWAPPALAGYQPAPGPAGGWGAAPYPVAWPQQYGHQWHGTWPPAPAPHPLLQPCRYEAAPHRPLRDESSDSESDGGAWDWGAQAPHPLLQPCRYEAAPHRPLRDESSDSESDGGAWDWGAQAPQVHRPFRSRPAKRRRAPKYQAPTKASRGRTRSPAAGAPPGSGSPAGSSDTSDADCEEATPLYSAWTHTRRCHTEDDGPVVPPSPESPPQHPGDAISDALSTMQASVSQRAKAQPPAPERKPSARGEGSVEWVSRSLNEPIKQPRQAYPAWDKKSAPSLSFRKGGAAKKKEKWAPPPIGAYEAHKPFGAEVRGGKMGMPVKPPPPSTTPGPGAYRYSTKAVEKVGPAFSMAVKRPEPKRASTPAPGEYSSAPVRDTHHDAHGPSRWAKSKAPQLYDDLEAQDRPGPGNYDTAYSSFGPTPVTTSRGGMFRPRNK